MSAWTHPVEETVTQYDQNGANPVTTTRTYHYNDPSHLQLTKLEEQNNDGQVRTTEFEYAHEQTSSPNYSDMVSENMLAQRYSTTVKEGTTLKAKQWTCWKKFNPGSRWRRRTEWIWQGGGDPVGKTPCSLSNPSPPKTDNASMGVLLTHYGTYDKYGRVKKQKDALGREVTFTYNEPYSNNNDLPESRINSLYLQM